MDKKLHKRLLWLFDNRTSVIDGERADFAKHRYVPRSFDGGSGWGVYDRSQSRFLSDPEVRDLPMDRLQNATHLS
jgi:hypothetical protein